MNEHQSLGVKGIGIDIVEIARIERALERRRHFAQRLFTPTEISYCSSRHRPSMHYAARFAAKEAITKAMGTGFRGGVSWREIEIARSDNGQLSVRLHGKTADIAQKNGHQRILLSVSFDKENAVASAVTLGKEG